MNVFITGGTGYIGRHLIPELLARGHTVRALVRPSSAGRLVRGAEPVVGDALNAFTYAHMVDPSDTFIHLVGVPHPSPAKAEEFRTVDLASIRESARAVRGSSVSHFIYLSVAMPAPVMREFVAVRDEGERLVRHTGVSATFVRPWYVLGPGHWWPYFILPAYWIWSAFDRDTAQRLYPVKLAQVVRALVESVENPPEDVRIIEAPEMRGRQRLLAEPDARAGAARVSDA